MFIKRILSFLFSMGLLTTLFVTNASEYNSLVGEETKRYIILLEEPEVLSDERASLFGISEKSNEDLIRQEICKQQNKIKSQVQSISSSAFLFSENAFGYLSFTDVLNGFVTEATPSQAEDIRSISGVKAVVEDKKTYISKPNDVFSSVDASDTSMQEPPESASTVLSIMNPGSIMGVEAMYEKGYDGEGRAIAILDTELDCDHNFFTLSDPSSTKFTKEDIENLILEKGLNIDLEVDEVYRNPKIPFAYNYETKSANVETSIAHGSHVSGIAAGNSLYIDDGTENSGLIRGVAPEAQILFFGVFQNDGSAYASTIIAAIDDAVKFGVDSINMSFGTAYLSENYTDETAVLQKQALANAEKAGCSVIYSAGNDEKGYHYNTEEIDYSAGDDRFHPHITQVGSIQGEYVYSIYLEDENGQIYFCDNFGTQTQFSLTDMVICDDITPEALELLDITNKVAVVKVHDAIEKTYTLMEAFQNPYNAGASSVIVISNANQITNTSGVFNFPAFYMPKSIGEELLENASSVKYDAECKIMNVYDAPARSYFTSYVYSDDLAINVDFSAPGGNIYSSVPDNKYANMSGTSMSTPQVTGAMALMYEFIEDAYPECPVNNKPKFIKSLLASTAETVYEENGAISSPRAVGSGIVRLDKAMQTGVILVSEDSDSNSVTLGDNLGDTFTVSFRVKNISSRSITFDSMLAELSTDDYKYYSSLGVYGFYGIKALDFTASNFEAITVEAGQDAIMSVDFKLNNNDIEYLTQAMINGFFVDGKITLSSSLGDNCDVGIPFVGFYGDWNNQPIVSEKNILKNFSLFFLSDVTAGTAVKKIDDEYVMHISEKPDNSFLNSKICLKTITERNAYVRVFINNNPLGIIADGVRVKEDFINKNYNTYTELNVTLNEIRELMKDGECIIKLELTLPYYKGTRDKQDITIKLIYDNEKPQIHLAQYKLGARKIAQITAVDNISVSSIFCFGYGGNNERVMAYKLYNTSEATFTVDITGFRGFDYIVYDSALNSNGIYSGVDFLKEDNVLFVKNSSGKDVDGFLIIAEYDNAGKLIKTHIPFDKSCTIPRFGEISYDVSSLEGKIFKAFLFKSETSISPLCDCYTN